MLIKIVLSLLLLADFYSAVAGTVSRDAEGSAITMSFPLTLPLITAATADAAALADASDNGIAAAVEGKSVVPAKVLREVLKNRRQSSEQYCAVHQTNKKSVNKH